MLQPADDGKSGIAECVCVRACVRGCVRACVRACVRVCVCVCGGGRYIDFLILFQLLGLPIRSRLLPLHHFIVTAASRATCEVSVLKPKHTRPPMHQTEISPHDKRGRWGISNT